MTGVAGSPGVEDEVLVVDDGDVLRITFNRPAVMNALDGPMLERVSEAVERTAARVVVLTGAGRAFSSGADLRRVKRGDVHGNGNRLVRAIVDAPRPVVAAVNGPTAGIAMSFVLAADVVVAHESAYFLQAFVNIGLMPDGGATELLAASVGRARASRLSLLGERLPAREAEQMGLVARCCGDDYDDEVEAVVERLASGPTLAYAATKAAIRATTLRHLDETLEHELAAQRRLTDTNDAQEGIQAFRDKRRAEFTGR